MIVGIFHPALNVCGGAEWVAINIINCVKKANYRTIVLTNEKVNQDKIQRLLGSKVNIDTQMIFPFELFQTTDPHNVYTDFIRTLSLKSKCDMLIDTYSNAILPGVNLTYVHFPFFGRLQTLKTKINVTRKLKNTYYLPYLFYEKRKAQNTERIIFANSKYTMNAVKKITGATPTLLYPPISKTFFDYDCLSDREDIVVSVDRISPGKMLTMIPHIAKLTDRKIRFLMIGIKESTEELNKILELIKKNGLSDRVEVMTNVSREKLQGILRTSKVFLHPAFGEHFGVSIAEAMASGCIPIVHNSGGPVEFVPQRFRFNKAEEVARKIEKAIFEWAPRHAKQFVQTAQGFSEENFSASFLKIFDSYVRNCVK